MIVAKRAIPPALTVVAWLFILGGIGSIISIIGDLAVNRRLDFDVGVIDLWIGLGLLRGAEKWRRWAVFMVIVGLVIGMLFFVFLIFGPAAPELKVFGRPIMTIPRGAMMVAVALLVALTLWQGWALRRPDVREIFKKNDPITRSGGSASQEIP